MISAGNNNPALDLDWLHGQIKGPHWGLLPAVCGLPFVLSPAFGLGGGAGIFLLAGLLVAGYDLATRKIPNILNIGVAVAGLAYALARSGLPGLADAALAGGFVFAVMSVFFFIGGIGAGDVKAMAALAVFTGGIVGALGLLVLTLIAGGALGVCALLVSLVKNKKVGRLIDPLWRRESRLPYGLAIAAGTIWFTVQRGGMM